MHHLIVGCEQTFPCCVTCQFYYCVGKVSWSAAGVWGCSPGVPQWWETVGWVKSVNEAAETTVEDFFFFNYWPILCSMRSCENAALHLQTSIWLKHFKGIADPKMLIQSLSARIFIGCSFLKKRQKTTTKSNTAQKFNSSNVKKITMNKSPPCSSYRSSYQARDFLKSKQQCYKDIF